MRSIVRYVLAGGLAIFVAAGAVPLAQAGENSPHALVVSANPNDRTPHVRNGRVESLAKIGDRVYVGGTFTEIKNWQGSQPVLVKPYLFAYSATTGAVDPTFNPVLNAPVLSLSPAPDGSGVFAAGKFTTVNGIARAGLVKLNPSTGSTVTTFKGVAGGGFVADIAIADGKLFMAGQFSKVRGVVRGRLAAVDVITGAVDPELDLPLTEFNQNTSGLYRLDVLPDGSRVVVIGNFHRIGGVERHQLAIIDRTTSPDSVASWWTNRYNGIGCCSIPTWMRDIDIDPTGTYFVIATTCCPNWDGSTNRPTLLYDVVGRWELNVTGEQEPTWWNYNYWDTSTSVAVTGAAVYVGGHFRSANQYSPSNTAGGVARSGLKALDPVTGVPFDWNPGRDRGYGVLDMLATPDQLIIGHDTNVVGGEWHPRLAAFPAAGGSAVTPQPAPLTLPVNIYALATSGPGAVATVSSFDGTSVSAPADVPWWTGDFSTTAAAFVIGNDLYSGRAPYVLERTNVSGGVWGTPLDVQARTDWWTAGGATPPLAFTSVTGAAYAGPSLYWTRAGDARLHMSGFNVTNGLTGTPVFISGVADGADWSDTRSLAVVGALLLRTTSSGDLLAYDLTPASGVPIVASVRTVSGPGVDGRNWADVEMLTAGF